MFLIQLVQYCYDSIIFEQNLIYVIFLTLSVISSDVQATFWSSQTFH